MDDPIQGCCKKHIRAVLFLATLLLPAVVQANTSESVRYDIRVLIDTSARMKQTDPQKLRIEAIQLLVKLLPANARAGIWTFDTSTQQLAPVATVTANWQMNAHQALAKIEASDNPANLGKAIQTAAAGWDKSNSKVKRTLIIISDEINHKLADHIVMNSVLKQLNSIHVTVHTISIASQKSLPILDKLAMHTGGLNLHVATASDLLKAITIIFEATIDTQGILIANNSFRVDQSINVLRLLLFRSDNPKTLALKSPDGKIVHAPQKSSAVNWQNEKQYDLITMNKPMTGKWHIVGNISNESMTMVTSDLQLNMSVLERHLFSTEIISIDTSLSQQNITIREKNFHNFVSIYLRQQLGNEIVTQIFSPKKTPLTRGFSGVFDTTLEASTGLQSLTVVAESPTFTRVKRQFIMIGATPLQFKETASAVHRQRKLMIKLEPSVLDIATTKIKLRHTESDEYAIKQDSNNKHIWHVIFKDFHKGKQQSLYITVNGETTSGRPFSYESAKIVLSGNIIPLRYYKSTIVGNIKLKPIVKPKPKYQPIFIVEIPFTVKQLPLRLASFTGQRNSDSLQLNLLVSLMMFAGTSSISLLLNTLWQRLRRRKLNKLQEVLTNVSTE